MFHLSNFQRHSYSQKTTIDNKHKIMMNFHIDKIMVNLAPSRSAHWGITCKTFLKRYEEL